MRMLHKLKDGVRSAYEEGHRDAGGNDKEEIALNWSFSDALHETLQGVK